MIDELDSISMRTKALHFSITKLNAKCENHNCYKQVVLYDFGAKIVWRCAVALVEILKNRRAVTVDAFIETYIKPLEQCDSKELMGYLRQVCEGKEINEKHIGAPFLIIFGAYANFLESKDIKTVRSFIENLYLAVDHLTHSSVDIETACQVHACISTDSKELKKLKEDLGSQAFEVKDFLGFTPLQYAAYYNNKAAVRLLLDQNEALANVGFIGFLLPLLLTSDKTVHSLLAAKTNIDTRIDGRTPLMLALEKNAMPVAHLLIQNGASRNVHDRTGRMPYHYAKDVQAYEFAIQGFDIIAQDSVMGVTSKCTAAKTGDIKLLTDLLAKEQEFLGKDHRIDNKDALKMVQEKLRKARKKNNQSNEERYKKIVTLLKATHAVKQAEGVTKKKEQKIKVEATSISSPSSSSSMSVSMTTEVLEVAIDKKPLSRNQIKKQNKRKREEEAQKKQQEEEQQISDAKETKRVAKKKAKTLLRAIAKMKQKSALQGWKTFVTNAKMAEQHLIMEEQADSFAKKLDINTKKNALLIWKTKTHDQRKMQEKADDFAKKVSAKKAGQALSLWKLKAVEQKTKRESAQDNVKQLQTIQDSVVTEDPVARFTLESAVAVNALLFHNSTEVTEANEVGAHEWFIRHAKKLPLCAICVNENLLPKNNDFPVLAKQK